MIISFIGTNPPSKSNVYYSTTLSSHLADRIKVDFIGFKKLYPNFLYPGGNYDSQLRFKEKKNLSIRKIITYYNPFSWIKAALTARGELIHSQWWSLPTAPIFLTLHLLLKLRRKKIILTVHNVLPHEESRIDRAITWLILKTADLYLVHSEKNAEQLSSCFRIPRKDIRLIPMGVHDMYLSRPLSQDDARKRLRLKDKTTLLLFGNLREYKGIDDMIRALEIINRQNDVQLLIAGEPWTSFSKYMEMINKKGLKDNVSLFLRYVPHNEVKYFFYASDIVVLPYKKFEAQSGIGNVALAFHRPIITTDVGGLKDLVKDKRALCRPSSPKSIANAIIKVIKDKKLMSKLSKDSRELADRYSWDSIAEKTVRIYKNELSRNGR